MAEAREKWQQLRQAWSNRRLVFIDETGVSTNMVRQRGRAPKSRRCLAKAPHGHWHTNAFVAALRTDGVTAPWLVDGAMNGDAFRAYITTQLVPTLRPGDMVIADNLSSHKVCGVREAIEQVGAELVFLPPYSPDFNPIEMFFSKLKAHLHRGAERSIDKVAERVGDVVGIVSPEECENYFKAAGYVSS
ncbi:MAG: IS630 family transposase [Opitutales bacterium]